MASAAILMGGAARRFAGANKSAIVIGGRTILERQLDALTPLTHDILSVGATPMAHPLLRSVADAHPGQGPLAGLEAALIEARHETLLLLACDLPFLSTEFLAYLLSLAPGVDAVVPRTNRGYHPLCAVYDRRCLDAVTRRLAAGELALKGLLSEIRVTDVPTEVLTRFGTEQRLLANVNTPADRDEAETLLNHEL